MSNSGATASSFPAGNQFLSALHSTRQRPLIIAHRGASAFAPENTLEAAELGRVVGADGWELDVQLTRDGVPVVIHDVSLARTTDVAVRFANDPRAADGFLVGAFDDREIRTLDAGSWFVAERGRPRSAAWFGTRNKIDDKSYARFTSGGVRIPTLRECLDWTGQSDWLVNVELKSKPGSEPELVRAVLAEVEAARVADRVLISSFDHQDVARVAHAGVGVATGVLAVQPLYRPERYVRDIVGATCYHPSAEVLGAAGVEDGVSPSGVRLRTEELRALGENGVPVLCYTVNDARPGGLGERLARAGVNALFSDDPAALIHMFCRPKLST